MTQKKWCARCDSTNSADAEVCVACGHRNFSSRPPQAISPSMPPVQVEEKVAITEVDRSDFYPFWGRRLVMKQEGRGLRIERRYAFITKEEAFSLGAGAGVVVHHRERSLPFCRLKLHVGPGRSIWLDSCAEEDEEKVEKIRSRARKIARLLEVPFQEVVE